MYMYTHTPLQIACCEMPQTMNYVALCGTVRILCPTYSHTYIVPKHGQYWQVLETSKSKWVVENKLFQHRLLILDDMTQILFFFLQEISITIFPKQWFTFRASSPLYVLTNRESGVLYSMQRFCKLPIKRIINVMHFLHVPTHSW